MQYEEKTVEQVGQLKEVHAGFSAPMETDQFHL